MRARQVVGSVIGWLFLLVGVVGLFVPILQGIILILIGLSILSKSSQRVRGLLDSLRARYPASFRRAEGIKHRMADRLRVIWKKIVRWVTL